MIKYKKTDKLDFLMEIVIKDNSITIKLQVQEHIVGL